MPRHPLEVSGTISLDAVFGAGAPNTISNENARDSAAGWMDAGPIWWTAAAPKRSTSDARCNSPATQQATVGLV